MKLLSALIHQLWPFPSREHATDLARYAREDELSLASIHAMYDFTEQELLLNLEAARRIADEEDRRKAGAESRATAFIAAIATLIPLMTWALGTTQPACVVGGACTAWAGAFSSAVVYLVFAAYWSLRTLEVSTYVVIGVEDVVAIKERRRPIGRELIKQTLLLARQNRNTINRKLTCIRLSQRSFFNGLLLLAVLLAIDPWLRFRPPPFAPAITVHPVAGTSSQHSAGVIVPEKQANPGAAPPASELPKP